jgi:hypothetical protein
LFYHETSIITFACQRKWLMTMLHLPLSSNDEERDPDGMGTRAVPVPPFKTKGDTDNPARGNVVVGLDKGALPANARAVSAWRRG